MYLKRLLLVTFMGCCLNAQDSFIMSQYCERGSLYDILHNRALELPWIYRMRLAVGAARGLVYLHSARPPFLHRDIKSLNILVDDSWTAKLADFGTLRVMKAISSTQLPETEVTNEMGTVRWTAPEILRARLIKNTRGQAAIQYTPAIDVYSYGVVLWEIATRKLPYDRLKFMHAVEERVLSGTLLHLEHHDSLPPGYAELVGRCMDKQPTARPSTIAMLQQLEWILRQLEQSAGQLTYDEGKQKLFQQR